MLNATKYNQNKGTIKSLTLDNKELLPLVVVELCEEIESLKLSGISTKKAKKEAIKTITTKYNNCISLISVIKKFLIDYDISHIKIAKHSTKLFTIRNRIKKEGLSESEVKFLFNV